MTTLLTFVSTPCSTPSVDSLKKAMQTYARQGGTSTIFINDDGLQLLKEDERNARLEFYANHGMSILLLSWVTIVFNSSLRHRLCRPSCSRKHA